MLFGLDGVEISLIIVFATLFAGIMSGFPVAFAIGGAGVLAFGMIAFLDSTGTLLKLSVDGSSQEYRDLVASGIKPHDISRFKFPDLPTVAGPLLQGGWETAITKNISFIANRMNERVIAGQSIEVLLAVAMFVLMGITLERSRIAEDLLTTMARVFGPLPGGLAVSVVVVGAFLAASTGIVGATVVTMGLLSLPTMLRNGYSPEIATGVISASGTLGQIIPPSIVIVLLGTLAGDLYSTAQENRAQLLGCSDALTYLGEAAVLSVGTLFQAAILPGVLLAALYAAYAFGYAVFNPSKAPPVIIDASDNEKITRNHGLLWFLAVPIGIIAFAIASSSFSLAGSQSYVVSSVSGIGEQAELRTNVGAECQVAMIEKHGQEKWDRAVAAKERIALEGGGQSQEERTLSPEEYDAAVIAKIQDAAPIGTGIMVAAVLFGIIFAFAYGVSKSANKTTLMIGGLGVVLMLLFDMLFISANTTPGVTFLIVLLPLALIFYSARYASGLLVKNDLIRVVFPPLVLIIAVLGSILGGITNPTPAAALGAAGAIMLAAYRKLEEENGPTKMILITAFAMVVMLLAGINFDLRVSTQEVGFERWVAFLVGYAAYTVSMGGILFACWTLYRTSVLSPVVRETAKVTSMVFAILIGSQMLNLVVISFGGEHYIQEFLRSFEKEWVVFLIVMLVLFILGFVLDFLEIIYIVVPIVGPVIYGGTMDPKWVTIMIAVNLQTSFLTPPFGFALFYLRGVAPPEVTTAHIYRGVIPFVLIQVVGLALLWTFPWVVTIVPNLLP